MSFEDKTFTTRVEWHRCFDCGRNWACETSVNGICPNCASRNVERFREEAERLARSNRSLRGALTRRALRGETR